VKGTELVNAVIDIVQLEAGGVDARKSICHMTTCLDPIQVPLSPHPLADETIANMGILLISKLELAPELEGLAVPPFCSPSLRKPSRDIL
jgi:hypothetical protein